MVSFWKSYDLKLGSRSGGAGSGGSCLAARGSGRNVCMLLLGVLSRLLRLDMVVLSATALRGGAPVTSGVAILSQRLAASLIAAAVVVAVRVDLVQVLATCTLKTPGPTRQIKVTRSVVPRHTVNSTKMACVCAACENTEYLTNKQNGNLKQVIFRFPSLNLSPCCGVRIRYSGGKKSHNLGVLYKVRKRAHA